MARRLWVCVRIFAQFIAFLTTTRAIFDRVQRRLIVGKIRRGIYATIPLLASHLQEKHQLAGECSGCGASCNILYRCPFWNGESRLCSVYDDRPLVCRLYPISPADIRDRDAVGMSPCGFAFSAGVRERRRESIELPAR